MSHFPKSLQVAAVAAALAAVPSAADAATVTLTQACYVVAGAQSQPIPVSVGGLTAGQAINLKLVRDATVAGSASGLSADGAGNLVSGIGSWYTSFGTGPKKEISASVQAVDAASGTLLAEAPAKLAKVGVSVTGKGKTRNWKVQGLKALTGKATYYAHYLNNNKYKGRLKLGKATGECGYLKTKKPLTPFSKLGRYDVYIQTSKKFDKAAPSIQGRVVVTKTYR